jgi:hypothetical protein
VKRRSDYRPSKGHKLTKRVGARRVNPRSNKKAKDNKKRLAQSSDLETFDDDDLS